MTNIFFCSEQKYYKFSNFTKTPFILDDKQWNTVEHYYQAMKTIDEDQQEFIRNSSTAKEAKARGLRVKLRDDWDKVKYQFMIKALRVKFSDEPYKSLLMDTGDANIYEDR